MRVSERSDDLGEPLPVLTTVRRVVSLVPSLTETVALTAPEMLVGATDWCSRPSKLDIPRVRGTKNPNLAAIRDLGPDLVLANKEENRRVDVEALRKAGIPVWVTDVQTVDGGLSSLRRLVSMALQRPIPTWLEAAEDAWRNPPRLPELRVVVPIWRDPWIVIGRPTFAGDLLRRLGLSNVFDDQPDRYPHVGLASMNQERPDVVLLPDEPYAFNASDGPEAFPDLPVALLRGRELTWYGPSLTTAADYIVTAVREALAG